MILFLTKRNVNINTSNDVYDKYLSNNFCVVQIVPDKMSLKHVISTFNIQLIALRGINAANHGNESCLITLNPCQHFNLSLYIHVSNNTYLSVQ